MRLLDVSFMRVGILRCGFPLYGHLAVHESGGFLTCVRRFDECDKKGVRRPPSSLLLRREITRALNPSATLPPLSVHAAESALPEGAMYEASDAGLDVLRM